MVRKARASTPTANTPELRRSGRGVGSAAAVVAIVAAVTVAPTVLDALIPVPHAERIGFYERVTFQGSGEQADTVASLIVPAGWERLSTPDPGMLTVSNGAAHLRLTLHGGVADPDELLRASLPVGAALLPRSTSRSAPPRGPAPESGHASSSRPRSFPPAERVQMIRPGRRRDARSPGCSRASRSLPYDHAACPETMVVTGADLVGDDGPGTRLRPAPTRCDAPRGHSIPGFHRGRCADDRATRSFRRGHSTHRSYPAAAGDCRKRCGEASAATLLRVWGSALLPRHLMGRDCGARGRGIREHATLRDPYEARPAQHRRVDCRSAR